MGVGALRQHTVYQTKMKKHAPTHALIYRQAFQAVSSMFPMLCKYTSGTTCRRKLSIRRKQTYTSLTLDRDWGCNGHRTPSQDRGDSTNQECMPSGHGGIIQQTNMQTCNCGKRDRNSISENFSTQLQARERTRSLRNCECITYHYIVKVMGSISKCHARPQSEWRKDLQEARKGGDAVVR